MATTKRKKGDKFNDKYGVTHTQVYKIDPDAPNLKIPPPGHFLYDETAPTTFNENLVLEIDESTKNRTVSPGIEVWTDKDNNDLYIADGRDRKMATSEANRRRRAEGRETLFLQVVPYSGTEEELVARVVTKNSLRRVPTPSTQGVYIRMLRDKGFTWDVVVRKLNVASDNPEVWCRARLPLAFCEREVRAAIDAGEFPLSAAREFGGTAPDGSKALGKKAQLELLGEKRELRARLRELGPAQKAVTSGARKRVSAALLNGEENLCRKDADAAKAIAAALTYVETGDLKALAEWPDVAKIVKKAANKEK